MKRRWMIATLVVVLAALGAVEGLRAFRWANRPAEARLVEKALVDIRRTRDPAMRAVLEAQAAKVYVQWNRRQARRWAEEALATFPAEDATGPTQSQDSVTAMLQQAARGLQRSSLLTDIAAVDPRLALRAIDNADGEDLREAVTAAAALAAAKTDSDLCRSLSRSIKDPGMRASVALAAWAVQARQAPKAALWREVEPFLTPIEQTKEPSARAGLLVAAGVLARRLGHPEAWERRLLPAFQATLDSVKDANDLGWIARDCLKPAVKKDPPLAIALTQELQRALLRRKPLPRERDYILAKILACAKPEEAVRLVSKQPPGRPRAASLVAVMLNLPEGHPEAAAAACQLMREDLQHPLSPAFVRVGVGEIARFQPDEALALGRQKNVDVSRIVRRAASRQPDWALAHLDLVSEPQDRAWVLLDAVSARVDRAASAQPRAKRH